MYARKKNKAATKSGKKYLTKMSQAGCVVGAARLGRRAASACGTPSSGRVVTLDAAARLGSRGGKITSIVHQLELKYGGGDRDERLVRARRLYAKRKKRK